MQLHDSKGSSSALALPMAATAAVTLFLLRNRQITEGNSPGSGVTIATSELLVRGSAIFHAILSVGAQGLSLLLHIATAPANFVFGTLLAEFRTALTAIDSIGAFLQHAAPYLLHML